MQKDREAMTFGDVLAFARRKGCAIAGRGALSLGVVLALAGLYWAFAPRQELFRQEVVVTLDNQNGRTVYPNDRVFSYTDFTSAPVLNRVWQERKLGTRVKFEDFCKWFSFVGYNRERAKLDAEYQGKMSKRNITVTELASLQREYEAKLASQAANNRYVLAMKPTCALSREEAVEILSSVPRAWFAEAAILNAPQMPSVIRAQELTAYVKRIQSGDGRALELVDALRQYRREIAATCDYIRHKVLRGRNAFCEGQDLGAYESRLDMVRAELLRLKNRLLVNGDPADLEGFVAARLDDMACETMAAEEKMKAVRQTIDLLKDTAERKAESPVRDGATAGQNVTLQADASFFQDFTAMVRRDASQESVLKFADELAQYAKELADIKARKLYYDQIAQYAEKTRGRAGARVDADKLFAEVVAYADEMQAIGAEVMAFRDKALSLYRTPDQFYALPANAEYARVYVLSLPRVTFGLLALWLLYNIACLVGAWNRENPA